MAFDPHKETIDHLFRNESGKMVSVLVKIFGTQHYQLAEDVVQESLLAALETWKFKGIPDNPKAWLYRTARNKAIDVIRRNKHQQLFDFSSPDLQLLNSGYTFEYTMNQFWEEHMIKDDFLGMMYACCHPDLSSDNQITFILKSLCGFSTKEIASAFITSEDTISKRVYRTKEYFRQRNQKPKIPNQKEIPLRTDVVLQTIYLIFNEGYASTHTESFIREDLIQQAMYLCRSLAESTHTRLPQVYALMALMCFHTSRLDSRISTTGELVLLPKQDRSKWDSQLIQAGNDFLIRSAIGEALSVYHLEAAISYTHCSAPKYEDTDWKAIVYYYDILLTLNPNPVTELNRIVAIMEFQGHDKALTLMLDKRLALSLKTYFPYHAVLGELYIRSDDKINAIKSLTHAISLTQSQTEKAFLLDKVQAITIE